MTRCLPRSLDEAVSDSPRTGLFQQTPNSAQATMQATSTSVLEPIASDQSLAQSPAKAETERAIKQHGKRPCKRPVKLHGIL